MIDDKGPKRREWLLSLIPMVLVAGTGALILYNASVAFPEDSASDKANLSKIVYVVVGVMVFSAFVDIALHLVPGIADNLIVAIKKYIVSGDDNGHKSRQEAALTVDYFSHQTKNAIKCMSFTLPIAIVFSIFMNDLSAILVGLGYCAIVVAFLALTHHRIKHGYFGSTAAEAAELIEFIATQTSEGSPPHSRKVSMLLLDRVKARVIELEDNAAPQKV